MPKRRGRKKLTVVGPHLGHKAMHHKGRRRKESKKKKA